MTNVLFNRETLKVSGLSRPALPFEVMVKDVEVSTLAKTVVYTETLEKEGLFLYQPPAGVSYEDGSEIVEMPGESGEPVMVTVMERLPLLDEEGKHISYIPEEGASPILCYTFGEKEVQKTDENGSPLFYTTVYKAVEVITEFPAEEITAEDERYTEGLPKAVEEVSRYRTISFNENMEEFTYGEVVAHKEKSITKGTFFGSGRLFEQMDEALFSTNLSTHKADMGFDFISIPAGGEIRTNKIPLPNPATTVGFKLEADGEITVNIGHLASALEPLNHYSEVTFTEEVSEVYVQFKNTTDKRIDVHSFALLV